MGCGSSKQVHIGAAAVAAAGPASTAGDCRTPEDVEKVFATFDTNGTGFIKEAQFDDFCIQVLGAPLDAEDRAEALAAASAGKERKTTLLFQLLRLLRLLRLLWLLRLLRWLLLPQDRRLSLSSMRKPHPAHRDERACQASTLRPSPFELSARR